MEFRRKDDAGCTPCPFSEPGQGDTSNPVYQNPPSESDTDCFTKNAAALLYSLDIAYTGPPGQITVQGCNALTDLAGAADAFYVLYHLDKTYCGLGQAHQTGDDPNVNSILTSCSHVGISDLVDPGWPTSSYQCSICRSTIEQSVQIASATFSAFAAATTEARTTVEPSSSTPLTTASSSFLTSPTSPSDDSFAATSEDPRIPAQGIAAIVVCTTLAIAAALLLLFCVIRRRRKQLEAYSGGMSRRLSRVTNEYIAPGRDTYEPLISPSQSFSGERPPLTPPPRLSDRKLLPSLLRPLSRSDSLVSSPPVKTVKYGSSGLYSTVQAFGDAKHDLFNPHSPATHALTGRTSSPFPASPFYAPISNAMTPRLERMQTYAQPTDSPEPLTSRPYTPLKSPPPVSFTFPPRTSLDTSTSSSTRSPPPPMLAARRGHHYRGTAMHPFLSSTSTTVSSGSGGGGGGGGSGPDYSIRATSANGSPTRPHRPHEAPLEIPDLVSPLSASTSLPPPTKLLPQPPSTIIGLAKTTGLAHPPREGSISLHSLAEQHKRDRDRDSWGSWGDEEEEGGTETAAGRMFGVSFPPADGSCGGG